MESMSRSPCHSEMESICFARQQLTRNSHKAKTKTFREIAFLQNPWVYTCPPLGGRSLVAGLEFQPHAASYESLTRHPRKGRRRGNPMKQLLKFKSPLHEMTQSTPTCLWNDSASIQELTYSIEHGAVGDTCTPVIVLAVLKKEMSLWKDRLRALIDELPTATEDQIAWQLVREISVKAAGLLKPIFDAQQGRNGRLSIQTDPRLYRDTAAIVAQADEFNRLAPNMIVK